VWLDLQLAHVVGVGEGEVAGEVDAAPFVGDGALGFGSVANNCRLDVADGSKLIAGLGDVGVHVADGQFASFMSPHAGCAGLGDVETEVGAAGDGADIAHIEDLA